MWGLKKLVAGILLLGLVSYAQAQTVIPEPGHRAHARFRSFYKNPDIRTVPDLLAELEHGGRGDWTDHPPIIGFLAGLLIQNPANLDFLPKGASAALRTDLAFALSLAGQRERALSFARQSGLSDRESAVIRDMPVLQRLTVRNGTELDFLWGAAFATGEPRYVRTIVRRFVQIADRPQAADDILAVSEFLRSKQGDLNSLKERHDRAGLLDIAMAGAMLMALARNAAEHDFIRTVVADEIPKGSHAERIFATYSGKRL